MNWKILPNPDEAVVTKLRKEVYDHEIISKLLAQRGIEDFDSAKEFFRPDLNKLHDPFLMKDMEQAVSRIERAISEGQKILIYGDYDVDGTTAVSMMYSFIKKHHSDVDVYIPDRYTEGYGVSFQGIDYAEDNDCSLIIALDCGIKAVDKVEYANQKKIDFIICDHHTPGDEIPEAVAVLDPKRVDDNYPYKELSGCGVGFKLIQAFAQQNNIDSSELIEYLDLVAVSIGADIVHITGENRILAHHGLKKLNSSPRPGFKAIMELYNNKEFSITDVVFKIAPRINAAGRMKHGKYAVRLMIQPDLEQARTQSWKINEYNDSRKETDKNITIEALKQIDEKNEKEGFSTVVYDENWHKGVIGIVASRLIETYYRPTVVFTKSGNKLSGSVRSVKGFDVYEALNACSDYIDQFGGHKYAAGLTVLDENYSKFKQKFEDVVRETISEDCLVPDTVISSEIVLSQIDNKFYSVLKQFAPFGPGNMHPVFMSKGLSDNGYGKKVGEDGSHIKLNIIHAGDNRTFNSIGFGLGEKIKIVENNGQFDAVYVIEENEWQGMKSLQLRLKDIKTSE
ncbi:MAG: single-stranded-DNA-specific exonuclease RecJ [Bacteroidota bacterium]